MKLGCSSKKRIRYLKCVGYNLNLSHRRHIWNDFKVYFLFFFPFKSDFFFSLRRYVVAGVRKICSNVRKRSVDVRRRTRMYNCHLILSKILFRDHGVYVARTAHSRWCSPISTASVVRGTRARGEEMIRRCWIWPKDSITASLDCQRSVKLTGDSTVAFCLQGAPLVFLHAGVPLSAIGSTGNVQSQPLLTSWFS